MNSEELLSKIKATGYWRINIRPTVFESDRIPHLSKCWEIVESAQTRLRGWDFPHIEHSYRRNMDNWIESGIDWSHIKEYWRFYQSGQFIHYSAFIEDYNELSWTSSMYEDGRPDRYLEIISTLYRLTEIFEFSARLASKDILSPGATVSIKLVDTKNRDLVFQHIRRHLSRRYTCSLPEIAFKRTYAERELLGAAREQALTAALHVYERFNWNNPPREVFVEDQDKLLERRL